MQPVNLAVIAGDPLLEEAVTAYLGSVGSITCLPPEQRRDADLLLILEHEVTDETISLMMRAAKESTRRDPRILLITDSVSKARLVRAFRYGLAGVLSRSHTAFDKIVETVFTLTQGGVEFPEALAPALIEEFRTTVGHGSAAREKTMKQLVAREVEVLRLLAEGLGTSEVATALGCSERTIKNILRQIVLRMGLRNRVHAVSYAFQVGAI